MDQTNHPVFINPKDFSGINGAIFGADSEDLNMTVVRWASGKGVKRHTNSEVDVVMIVLDGEGEVVIENQTHALIPGTILLIPKNATRSIVAKSQELTIANIHKKRRLMPRI